MTTAPQQQYQKYYLITSSGITGTSLYCILFNAEGTKPLYSVRVKGAVNDRLVGYGSYVSMRSALASQVGNGLTMFKVSPDGAAITETIRLNNVDSLHTIPLGQYNIGEKLCDSGYHPGHTVVWHGSDISTRPEQWVEKDGISWEDAVINCRRYVQIIEKNPPGAIIQPKEMPIIMKAQEEKKFSLYENKESPPPDIPAVPSSPRVEPKQLDRHLSLQPATTVTIPATPQQLMQPQIQQVAEVQSPMQEGGEQVAQQPPIPQLPAQQPAIQPQPLAVIIPVVVAQQQQQGPPPPVVMVHEVAAVQQGQQDGVLQQQPAVAAAAVPNGRWEQIKKVACDAAEWCCSSCKPCYKLHHP